MCPAVDVRRYFRTVLLDDKLDLTSLNKIVPVLMAQSALETGHWRSMYCWNWGNVRPGAKWTGAIMHLRCNEILDGKVVWFDPPAPGERGYADPRHGSSFRGFLTALEGAKSYIKFIRDKYPEAYAAALRGEASAFVHALKARGYFTAAEGPYVSAVVKLLVEFKKLDDPLTYYASPPLPWEDLRRMTGMPSRAKDIQRALNAALAIDGSPLPALVVDGILGPKSKTALDWAEHRFQTTSIEDTLKAIGVA